MGAFARWCLRHRKLVVIGWVVGLIGLGVISSTVGSKYSTDFQLPDTESTRAVKLLETAFPTQSGETDRIVVHVDQGTVRDQQVRERVETMQARIRQVNHVADVGSPYDPVNANQISRDGKTAFATVTFDNNGPEVDLDVVKRVISIAKTARAPGLQVELGGSAIQQTEQPSTGPSELIGVLAAAVILFIAFGSLLAMALPLITAILAIGSGLFLIVLLTHVMHIADFAPQLAALIGLGAGIDYALFIITRYRQNVQGGMEPEAAVSNAVNTSGRAVLFAGITVCISVLGMFALGVSFLYGLAVAAAVAVALTMFAALSLLPAMIGLFGRHVLSRREQRQLAAEGPHAPELSGSWGSWARWVQRHKWSSLTVSLGIIVVLCIPFFDLRLGVSDEGNGPKTATTRKAYDLLAAGFGPGFNGPFTIAVDTSASPQAKDVVNRLEEQLRSVPGVAAVSPPVYGPDQRAAIVTIYPTTAPQSVETEKLLQRLRNQVIPSVVSGTSVPVYVGGLTAIFEDFSTVLKHKLPQFIGIVILLSFLLLMTVFRSLLIPLKAAILNLFSIAAALGAIVAIFQWGWGASLIGVDRTGPIEPFLPVMIFAILFGLSMDYEVFLVSRIHEEWVRTRDNGTAVVRGLAATGRVITAAAAIMIVIFGSFALGGERAIKLFGISFAFAVFLDAFLIRSVLVPAFMAIVGKANWWMPAWLDRLLPDVQLEADDLHDDLVPEFVDDPVEPAPR
ncbi:MAG: putative drug exporter of the superfamily [Frankiales bacterium]|nr:putative drug exporter of the superfamily [Frankiales bacterium]